MARRTRKTGQNGNPKDIGLWRLLAEDFKTHDRNIGAPGFWAVALQRFGNYREAIRWRPVRAPLTAIHRVLHAIVAWWSGIELGYTLRLGRRVRIWHRGGIFLNAFAIGDDVEIYERVTLGVKHRNEPQKKPTIAQRTVIAPGACVLGDVTVGERCVIGPNSVVTKDLPPDSLCIGRQLRHLDPADIPRDALRLLTGREAELQPEPTAYQAGREDTMDNNPRQIAPSPATATACARTAGQHQRPASPTHTIDAWTPANHNPDGHGLLALVREDFRTYDRNLCEPGFWAVVVHRFGNWRMEMRWKIIRAPMTAIYLFFYTLVDWLWGINLPFTVKLGRRLRIWHHGGIVIGARAIGDDVHIRQNTTIGIIRRDAAQNKPVIGDRVDIGCGACILGDVTIGSDAIIGANSVVTRDVPPKSTAFGVPARVFNTIPQPAIHTHLPHDMNTPRL